MFCSLTIVMTLGCFVFLFRKKLLFFTRPHLSQVPVVVTAFSSAASAAAAGSNDIRYTRNVNIYEPPQATDHTANNC